MFNTNEGNSLKNESNLPKNNQNNKYMSCPCTPDNPKTEANANKPRNYDLFEKKSFFSQDFKKKFQETGLLNILDKFVNNLLMEDNIKNMKKNDIEKLDFLNNEEKIKVNMLLNEIKGETMV